MTGAMGNLLIDHEALLEATRVRLSKAARQALQDHFEAWDGLSEDKHDALVANGLRLLLDMHDKLEAIRHGQG